MVPTVIGGEGHDEAGLLDHIYTKKRNRASDPRWSSLPHSMHVP